MRHINNEILAQQLTETLNSSFSADLLNEPLVPSPDFDQILNSFMPNDNNPMMSFPSFFPDDAIVNNLLNFELIA